MRWFFLWGLAVMTACVVPGGSVSGVNGEGGPPPGKGLMVLNWKLDPAQRSVLGSAWASANADAYELILLGPGNQAVDLTTGPGQVVAVDPGTWRVILLAGIKRTSGSTTAFLVGSALAEDVVVTEGQRTAVELVLKSIDLALAPTGPACWKAGLTVSATGKTRNPRLGMLLEGASTASRPRFKSAELWNGYKEASSVTGTPDDWAAEAAGTVPDAATSLQVGLVGAALCVQDTAAAWIPLAGLAKASWFWPNRADVADTHPLAPLTEVLVPAGPPPTGVEVSVIWE